MPSRLSSAHIVGQERIRALVRRGVELRWDGLPGYDEEHVAPFLQAVVPLVNAAQRQSISLTDAYVARSLDRAPSGVDAASVIVALRGDTTPEQVFRRPFVKVWTALSNDVPYEQAVAAGRAQATGSAAMDVQMASRGAMQAIQDRDGSIRGWQRVADAGACAFCLEVDGAFVKSADAMALHPGCGCGLEPVTGEVTVSSEPDGVAVHEHGELGPVLGAPSHDFTSAADLG